MADTPVVTGPLPLWYVAACQTSQYNAGVPGGWGGERVFDALATVPGVGVSRREWRDNATGFIPSSTAPTAVVLQFANLAAFPAIGQTARVYVATNTGKFYRWTGSVYAEVTPNLPGY
jgi:hypothetical protein